jgi:hypothetical protein
MVGVLVDSGPTRKRLLIVGVLVIVVALVAAAYVSPRPPVRSIAVVAVPVTTVPSTTVPTPTVPTPTVPSTTIAITALHRLVVAPPATPLQKVYGCGPALTYLAARAAPGFRFVCPGYALGHQGFTCLNIADVCPDDALIVISDPCPAAYMNEASNSWVVKGWSTAPFDPFGACSAAGTSLLIPNQVEMGAYLTIELGELRPSLSAANQAGQTAQQRRAQKAHRRVRHPAHEHGRRQLGA